MTRVPNARPPSRHAGHRRAAARLGGGRRQRLRAAAGRQKRATAGPVPAGLAPDLRRRPDLGVVPGPVASGGSVPGEAAVAAFSRDLSRRLCAKSIRPGLGRGPQATRAAGRRNWRSNCTGAAKRRPRCLGNCCTTTRGSCSPRPGETVCRVLADLPARQCLLPAEPRTCCWPGPARRCPATCSTRSRTWNAHAEAVRRPLDRPAGRHAGRPARRVGPGPRGGLAVPTICICWPTAGKGAAAACA